jgi:brefeldin A-inhibited guanine nucleotide-exchange protein
MCFSRESIKSTDSHDAMADVEPDVRSKLFTANDLFVKDAFLVFRALCKLTMKPLNTERLVYSLLSEFYRSKLSKQRT